MNAKLFIAMIVTSLFLSGGCSSLNKTVISITSVRNTVMNELGRQYRAGLISSETDRRIIAVDRRYRDAVAAAQLLLETYRDVTRADTVEAIQAVKNSVLALIDILAEFQDTTVQQHRLKSANSL